MRRCPGVVPLWIAIRLRSVKLKVVPGALVTDYESVFFSHRKICFSTSLGVLARLAVVCDVSRTQLVSKPFISYRTFYEDKILFVLSQREFLTSMTLECNKNC